MHEAVPLPFYAEPSTWVVVAFVLFFILFGRKLWAPLSGMLDARAEKVKAELEEAKALRREADAMLKAAERERDGALQDAKAMIEGAKAEAGRITAAAAAEAESSARRREKMALDRIAAAEKAAVEDVRMAAADIATTAARQVLTEELTPDADAELIDQAITQLPSALAARRAA